MTFTRFFGECSLPMYFLSVSALFAASVVEGLTCCRWECTAHASLVILYEFLTRFTSTGTRDVDVYARHQSRDLWLLSVAKKVNVDMHASHPFPYAFIMVLV